MAPLGSEELVPILGWNVQDNPDGWSWLQYLNNSVDGQSPKIIVAEDGYNDWAVSATSQGGAGFDSQWDPNFHWPAQGHRSGQRQRSNMWAIRDAVNFAYNGDPFNGSCTPRTTTKWPTAVQGSRNHLAGQRGQLLPRNAHAWRGLGRDGASVPMIFHRQEFLEDEYFRDSDALDWSKKTPTAGCSICIVIPSPSDETSMATAAA